MAKGDDEALGALIAIGALLAAIWLGSKKKCSFCGEDNDRLASNCKRCGGKI